MQSTNLLLRCCKDCTKDAFTFTLLMCSSTNLTPFTPVLNISDIFLLLKRRHCNCTSSAVSLCDIITTWPLTSYEDNEKTESSTEVTSEWIDRSELFLYKHVSCVLGWNDPLNRQYILTWVVIGDLLSVNTKHQTPQTITQDFEAENHASSPTTCSWEWQ